MAKSSGLSIGLVRQASGAGDYPALNVRLKNGPRPLSRRSPEPRFRSIRAGAREPWRWLRRPWPLWRPGRRPPWCPNAPSPAVQWTAAGSPRSVESETTSTNSIICCRVGAVKSSIGILTWRIEASSNDGGCSVSEMTVRTPSCCKKSRFSASGRLRPGKGMAASSPSTIQEKVASDGS